MGETRNDTNKDKKLSLVDVFFYLCMWKNKVDE